MNPDRPWGSMLSPEHYEAARRIGEEGIVLLQNKGNVLPIDLNRAKKILVVGENAIKMMTVGGGSSSLKVQRELSPLDGIKQRVAGKAEVVYARGYVGDASGEYNGVVTGQNLKDDRTPEELIAEAVKEARDADYVIFIGGLEQEQRPGLRGLPTVTVWACPTDRMHVISALAEANKNLDSRQHLRQRRYPMPWVERRCLPSLQAWYLGSEAGSSLAANPRWVMSYPTGSSDRSPSPCTLGGLPGPQLWASIPAYRSKDSQSTSSIMKASSWATVGPISRRR